MSSTLKVPPLRVHRPRNLAGEPSISAVCSHENWDVSLQISARLGHMTYGKLAVVAPVLSGGPVSVLGVQIFHSP